MESVLRFLGVCFFVSAQKCFWSPYAFSISAFWTVYQNFERKMQYPRDQQIRELLSVYDTMTQQPNESVADFAHWFSEIQHWLDKLIPGIHKTAGKEIELIFAFVNKLRSRISKELLSREFKFDKLQEIIEAAQRYEHHVTPTSVKKNIQKPIQTEVFITGNNYKPPGRYSNNQQRNRSFNKSNVASNNQSSDRKFDSKRYSPYSSQICLGFNHYSRQV